MGPKNALGIEKGGGALPHPSFYGGAVLSCGLCRPIVTPLGL